MILEILISYFIGCVFFFVFKYLTFIYFSKNTNIIFTEGISTTEITFTKDYQELLNSKLGDDPSYDIHYEKTYNHILNSHWTLFDIIDWLKLINEQDYAVKFELVSKNADDLLTHYPKITLCNEFVINNNSNPVLISTLLSTELENIYNMFDAEYNEDHYIVIRYTVLIASR